MSMMLLFLILVSICFGKQETQQHMTVNQLHTSFGAEVSGGVDIGLGLTEDEFAVLSVLLVRHKVLVVRSQRNMSVEDLRSFTLRFGVLHVHLESASHYPGYTDVNVVSNIRNKDGNFIGLYGTHVENFHSDLSWAHVPTKVTVLKSVIRPNECGNTRFLDSTAAYEALNSTMKQFLFGKRAAFCYLKTRKLESEVGLTADEISSARNCANHPVITTHPVTGMRNIYANPSHTSDILDVDQAISDSVLTFLYEHTKSEAFQYEHIWQDDDLVLWDNRQVHHAATSCPEEYPRMLIRATVLNEAAPE